jgi:ParB-like chromosome segregation protein Spo0J
MTTTNGPKQWRARFQVYPSADIFPMLADQELDELARDIKERGQEEPIVIWRRIESGEEFLVDGRNRLEAMDRAGLQGEPKARIVTSTECVDPNALIASLNIKRRHLTPAKRANLAAKLLSRSTVVSENVSRNRRGGRPKSLAGHVADLADVSKPVAREQLDVAADAGLQAQVDAGAVTPEQAGRAKRTEKAKRRRTRNASDAEATSGGTRRKRTRRMSEAEAEQRRQEIAATGEAITLSVDIRVDRRVFDELFSPAESTTAARVLADLIRDVIDDVRGVVVVAVRQERQA